MTAEELLAEAYNAHEHAESAMMEALYAHVRSCSVDALSCLADPKWNWQSRSWLSSAIIDAADTVLNEKLDEVVAMREP